LEKRIGRNATTLVLIGALFAFGVMPLIGAYASHTTTLRASAYSDPIATGNWQYDQFDSSIVQQAQVYGINPFVVKGLIMLESGFNQYAQSTVINSACGWTHDLGLMQVNAYCDGISPPSILFNPATNIYYGTAELGRAYQQLGDVNLALQAYNIGLPAVLSGQRNWAYSTGVMNYASQFQIEHAAVYGSNGGTGSGGGSSSSASPQWTYTVQSGDTLSSIGSRYGISYQAIAQANGISYPYLIYVGEQLTLPSSSSSSSSTYTVKSGDTLWQIGVNSGVSWQSIAQANGISSPFLIYPGEQLTIP